MISRSTIGIGAVLLLLLSACNERLPFEPITTTDSDWTPSIALWANDYQRIEIGIEDPPRRELLRNITSYVFQIREDRTGEVVFLDTLGNYLPPSYIGSGVVWPQDSWPVLQYSTAYSTQVSINYHAGDTKPSNSISFTTPPERGKVIRRISIPPNDFSDILSLACHKGDVIICGGNGRLLKFDTTTGQRTMLNNYFYPPSNLSSQSEYQCLAVIGDTLYTFYENGSSAQYTIVAVDLNTLAMKSSPKVSLTDKRLAQIISAGSSLYGLWYSDGIEQIAYIDPATGTLSSVLPEEPWAIYTSANMVSDGKYLWVSRNNSFNNLVVRYDPATLQALDQKHNPVFSSNGLAWDGANFWVVDIETRTIAKLQLSGN